MVGKAFTVTTSANVNWLLEDEIAPYIDDYFFVVTLKVAETDEVVKIFQHYSGDCETSKICNDNQTVKLFMR